MRALLLADSCNPQWPSLPVVGYKAARSISRVVDTVLATHVRNQPAIEAAGGCGKAEVVYLDNEYIAAPLHKLSLVLRGGRAVSWTTAIAASYPAYLAFEREAYRHFRTDLTKGCFDVLHRITPMSPALPSPLARWSPVPFVLGPLNGGLSWPPGYGHELRREREYLTYLRKTYKLLPYHRSTYNCSAAILASFQHTLADLPTSARERAIDFPEVGIDPELFSTNDEPASYRNLNLLFAGRLVPYKCADVAIGALAEHPALRRHRLTIVGDGPERRRLERLVRDQGLDSSVEFAGWRTQSEVARYMRDSDVFLFPSVRELGAGVVVEAMASGCVPAVVDYGAPGSLVTPDCGVRVPLAPKAELTHRFANVLEELAANRDRRLAMREAARERALTHYAWDAKALKMREIYRWVIGTRETKPCFDEIIA